MGLTVNIEWKSNSTLVQIYELMNWPLYLGFENEEISPTNHEPPIQIQIQMETRKQGLDQKQKQDERHFFLYTATNGEETQIVAGEKFSKSEIRFVTLPEMLSYVVEKNQLQGMTKFYWKPVHKKKERLDQFMRDLVAVGDIGLMQKAFSQFYIEESTYSNPFSWHIM